jgi:hypothetical protein
MILKVYTQEDKTTYVLYPEIEGENIIVQKIANGVKAIVPEISAGLVQIGEDPKKGFGISV